MKKFRSLVVLLLSFALCGALLAGCGSSNSGITGTFALTGLIDAGGNELTLAEYAEANGVTEDDLASSYTFNGDGTGTMTTLGVETEITYEESGSSVTVSINGIDYECELSGDTLTMTDSNTGIQSVMTKQ